jgi:hypothetical protein
MPNLVDNRLIVRGGAAGLAAFLGNHVRTTPWSDGVPELDFGSIIPLHVHHSPEEAIAVWGTKWNARDTVVLAASPHEVEVSFTTAWAIPEPVYRRLGQLHPYLSFLIEAIDPDLWAVEGCVRGEWAEFREAADFASLFARFYDADEDHDVASSSRLADSDANAADILIRTIERKYR